MEKVFPSGDKSFKTSVDSSRICGVRLSYTTKFFGADILLVEQSIGDKSDNFENHSDEVVLLNHSLMLYLLQVQRYNLKNETSKISKNNKLFCDINKHSLSSQQIKTSQKKPNLEPQNNYNINQLSNTQSISSVLGQIK